MWHAMDVTAMALDVRSGVRVGHGAVPMARLHATERPSRPEGPLCGRFLSSMRSLSPAVRGACDSIVAKSAVRRQAGAKST